MEFHSKPHWRSLQPSPNPHRWSYGEGNVERERQKKSEGKEGGQNASPLRVVVNVLN